MSELYYNIILTGEFSKYADKARAIAAFARLTKIELGQAESIFAKAPYTIKTDLDKVTAKKYLDTFNNAGIVVKVQNANVQNTNDREVASPTPAATKPPQKTATKPTPKPPEKQPGLQHTIVGRPDYSFLIVKIPGNETIKVEASAMASMDTNIQMKTKLKGGFGRFLTGENIFINEFTAEGGPGEIGIAPGTPGDLFHQYLTGNSIFLQNSAFVAATMGVEVETKWQGMIKGFFSSEGLFLIRCSGKGDLWFNSYGAIIEIDVDGDYVVDTGNIVAFTEGLTYNITKVGGYKSLFFSGEGFVCRFSGKGKVWIQSRGSSAFVSWAHAFRPVKKN